MTRKTAVCFGFAILVLSLATSPALAGKTRLITNTSSSIPTVPFINAGPADDSTAATGLGVQVNGTEMMRVTATGTVGVGTANPMATQDINGDLKIGTKGQTCDTNHAGLIQYTASGFQGCNGLSWVTFAAACPTFSSGSQLFTSSGTFTPPSGVSANCPLPVRVLVVGGGGGAYGGGGIGGGGGSGYVSAQSLSLTGAATITVGSGGTGGGGATSGTNGGVSVFGSSVTANGGTAENVIDVNHGGNGGSGGGGYSGGSGGTNGSNGTGSTRDGIGQGSPIVSSVATVLGITFNKATFSAGSGGGQSSTAGGGAGGINVNSAGPSGGSPCASGGIGYGAGGGSSCSYAAGGVGAAGVVYVEW